MKLDGSLNATNADLIDAAHLILFSIGLYSGNEILVYGAILARLVLLAAVALTRRDTHMRVVGAMLRLVAVTDNRFSDYIFRIAVMALSLYSTYDYTTIGLVLISCELCIWYSVALDAKRIKSGNIPDEWKIILLDTFIVEDELVLEE